MVIRLCGIPGRQKWGHQGLQAKPDLHVKQVPNRNWRVTAEPTYDKSDDLLFYLSGSCYISLIDWKNPPAPSFFPTSLHVHEAIEGRRFRSSQGLSHLHGLSAKGTLPQGPVVVQVLGNGNVSPCITKTRDPGTQLLAAESSKSYGYGYSYIYSWLFGNKWNDPNWSKLIQIDHGFLGMDSSMVYPCLSI